MEIFCAAGLQMVNEAFIFLNVFCLRVSFIGQMCEHIQHTSDDVMKLSISPLCSCKNNLCVKTACLLCALGLSWEYMQDWLSTKILQPIPLTKEKY